MNVRKWLLPLLVLSIAVAPAMPAHAMTWGGDIFGAFNTHTMGDWNDAIDASNAGGSDFDNINSSIGGGIGLRILPNPTWMIEGTWEPLFPTTEDNVSGDKLELTANSFQGTLTYFFPTAGKSKFGLGGGVGFYTLNGKGESAGSPDVEVKGSGVGFHVLGMGEWEVSPGFAMFGGAGYRMAKITDTEINGVSTVPETETDFSGLTIRAGLAFYMPSSTP